MDGTTSWAFISNLHLIQKWGTDHTNQWLYRSSSQSWSLLQTCTCNERRVDLLDWKIVFITYTGGVSPLLSTFTPNSNQNGWQYSIFFIVYKSYQKTKPKNKLIFLLNIICNIYLITLSQIWSLLSNAIKNTSVGPSVALWSFLTVYMLLSGTLICFPFDPFDLSLSKTKFQYLKNLFKFSIIIKTAK